MANRYWVGGTGNWSDNTNHWSATSNGTAGASLPTSADNVYFDANSFTATGQTVTVNVAANCLDMDWTGATNNPTFAMSYLDTSIYGSLIFNINMSIIAMYPSIYLKANVAGKTIDMKGKSIGTGSFYFSGNGGWTLQSAVNVFRFSQIAGTINTNNQAINCTEFSSDGAFNRTLTLGDSIITCLANVAFTATGLTMPANTAKIIMTGNTKTFAGGGKTFYNVEFQGTPITITGSNTFNDLKISAGKTVNFTAGTTQTVTTLSGAGASGSLVTIQSATAGTPFTISKASGSVTVDYWSIKDCTATGGATFNATNSTDVSGNTGWTFSSSWTCPNLKPRIDGVIKSMVSGSVRIDGALKTVDSMWARIDGALKKL